MIGNLLLALLLNALSVLQPTTAHRCVSGDAEAFTSCPQVQIIDAHAATLERGQYVVTGPHDIPR